MAGSLNMVMLIGNLGKDRELPSLTRFLGRLRYPSR